MPNKTIIIVDFEADHQPGISELLDDVQSEFTITIYGQYVPKTPPPPVRLWVALHRGVVTGTVGVALITGHNAMLKSMFVQKEYRGGSIGLSDRLLATALAYAVAHDTLRLYLGTMSQFKAAQRFYDKHGFVQISENELPHDFYKNPVDDVFFVLHLKSES